MTTQSKENVMWARFAVEPGSRVRLAEHDPGTPRGLTRERADAARPQLAAEFAELQELLYAARTHALLVILQGMDTSGKDGTIKSVMDPVNPQGVRVRSFKVPTHEELAHDFLWRAHAATPELGMIGIFNRSHYEDVLVVRVHDLVPAATWRKRYRHINDFERLLSDSGTIVLKFFLHISREEQEERLLAREKEVEKAWKLSVGDWRERTFWDEYTKAYEDALSKTSTENAPWFIIPANKKWARNHVVLATVVEALRPHRAAWLDQLSAVGKKAAAELEAFHGQS
jgi:PPK2 family polyphosphate:nucleotide phosphotransferase